MVAEAAPNPGEILLILKKIFDKISTFCILFNYNEITVWARNRAIIFLMNSENVLQSPRNNFKFLKLFV